MAITIEIAGQERTGYHWNKMNIIDVYAPSGDVLTIPFTLTEDGDPAPEVGQLISVTFTDSQGRDDILFAGPITETKFRQRPSSHSILVNAEDLTRRLDSKLVSGIYTEDTVEEMVQSLLNTYAPTFKHTELDAAITAGVGLTPILPKIFNWKRLSEVLQELAEEKRYNWYVDFDGEVIFMKTGSTGNEAPIGRIVPSSADTLVGDFQFTTSIEQLINAIFIKEFFFWSPNLLFEPADETGEDYPDGATGFNNISGLKQPKIELLYEPTDISDMSVQVKEGTDDWEDYTVRVLQSAPTGSNILPGSAYVDLRAKKMVLYHKDGISEEFADPTLVRFVYRPLQQSGFPEVSLNIHSIGAFRTREGGDVTPRPTAAGDGEYQLMISFGDLEFAGEDPRDTLLGYVNDKLDNYAWPLVSGKFTIYYDGEHDIGVAGWKAGQRFELLEASWGLFDYERYWLTGNKEAVTCWITSVNTQAINPETLKFEISFTSRLGRL